MVWEVLSRTEPQIMVPLFTVPYNEAIETSRFDRWSDRVGISTAPSGDKIHSASLSPITVSGPIKSALEVHRQEKNCQLLRNGTAGTIQC
jgi:hypothetical protein